MSCDWALNLTVRWCVLYSACKCSTKFHSCSGGLELGSGLRLGVLALTLNRNLNQHPVFRRLSGSLRRYSCISGCICDMDAAMALATYRDRDRDMDRDMDTVTVMDTDTDIRIYGYIDIDIQLYGYRYGFKYG